VDLDDEVYDNEYRCPECALRTQSDRMVALLEKIVEADKMALFVEPVTEAEAPRYHDVIKTPMDFSSIRQKLTELQYSDWDDFKYDLNLVWRNAKDFNPPTSKVYKVASALQTLSVKLLAEYSTGAFNASGADAKSKTAAAGAGGSADNIDVDDDDLPIRPVSPSGKQRNGLDSHDLAGHLDSLPNGDHNGLHMAGAADGAEHDPLSLIERMGSHAAHVENASFGFGASRNRRGGQAKDGSHSEDVQSELKPWIEYHQALCSDLYLHRVDLCYVCGSAGDWQYLLFCVDCGEGFHAFCLNPPVELNEKRRTNWRCANCMMCSKCGRADEGEANPLLVCDVCDQGRHLKCASPALTKVPPGVFKCEECTECRSCYTRQPRGGDWNHNFTLCGGCTDRFSRGEMCPVCDRAWDGPVLAGECKEEDLLYVACDGCRKWVHEPCDRPAATDAAKSEAAGSKYFCQPCRARRGTAGHLFECVLMCECGC